MKARSKRKREAARTFTDGKRRDNPLPLGKLRTDAPPKPPSVKPNKSMHRFPAKPWFKVDASALKTHAQKRAERAVARWKQGATNVIQA